MKIARAIQITQGDVTALVGGGGKTSSMFQLASELPATWRVLITTTTRIFAAQIKQASAWLTYKSDVESFASLLTRLDELFVTQKQVLLIGHADEAINKAFGVAPSLVDELAATGRFDAIIVEADGSRMCSFKAPATHEPVIPACTSIVIPVVGLDVIAQPLHPNYVHRAELVSRLTETPINQPVSAQTVTQVLSHAQGGLKNVPPQAKVIPLLNKADAESGDTISRLSVAQHMAQELLQTPRISAVMIGQVRQAKQPILECHARVAVVILAAGGASRFGSPKQLALWQGQSLLERAVEAVLAASVDSVTVVLGSETAQSERLLTNYPVQVVVNHDWATGQSSSMQAGLNTLPKNINGVLFMLVDLPNVTSTIIDLLITRYQQTLAPIVWPEFEGRRGNPVLFDQTMFAELHTIRGDQGGRAVIKTHQHVAERVAVSHAGILQDIDHPEDLAKIKGFPRK
ncbi:selenium cofactor biosynthesis protein YqeC [Anaerolineales bacterium HSG6]|nr:selenium cofactor biosynthesis protein YqeC [Anaerolineales bacterium HSG6]